jgi:serine/threonine protein kinase
MLSDSFVEMRVLSNFVSDSIFKELGRGAFSVVQEVTYIPTGEKFAMKSLTKRFITEKGWTNLKREIDIMIGLNHPNVLKVRRKFLLLSDFG